MTDSELIEFLKRHLHWSEAQKLAFVEANMEFDEAAERRKLAKAVIDDIVARGELVTDGHGRVIERDRALPGFADPHPERPN